jgi:tRNA A37 threonylcarbamoyladenosine dehydratase
VIISSMGAACRTDPTRVRAADLSKTRHCRLARFVRKRLKKRGIRSGIQCVYSEEPAAAGPAQEADLPDFEEPSRTVDGQHRPPLGSCAWLPPVFGFTAAAEAVRLLLEQPRPTEPA